MRKVKATESRPACTIPSSIRLPLTRRPIVELGATLRRFILPRLQSDIDAEALREILRSHWINPELLAADKFGECFVERGEAMLKLIGEVMGKAVPSGTETFLKALNSAGIEQATDEFDDTDEEHDVVGEWAYRDVAVAD